MFKTHVDIIKNQVSLATIVCWKLSHTLIHYTYICSYILSIVSQWILRNSCHTWLHVGNQPTLSLLDTQYLLCKDKSIICISVLMSLQTCILMLNLSFFFLQYGLCFMWLYIWMRLWLTEGLSLKRYKKGHRDVDKMIRHSCWNQFKAPVFSLSYADRNLKRQLSLFV